MSQPVDREQGALGPAFEQPMEQPEEQPPARSAYILLVDDDPEIRTIVRELMGQEGYAITVARTGAEALASAPARPPALVLLDSTLPGEHPREVAAMLRQRAGWEAAPIVLFTAIERRQATAMARAVGADAVIAKPFELDEMLALVERYLKPAHSPASD